MSDSEGIFSPQFARLAAVSGTFFLATGAALPVLPKFMSDQVGLSDTMIGVVVGATAVGSILGRPVVGRIGDSRGRPALMVGGGLISAVAMLGILVSDAVPVLMLLRVLFGVGQGAVVVGASAMAVDLAPDDRSGEATSYVFVALHLGLGTGAIIGEWIRDTWSFNAVWIACGVGMSLAALIATTMPNPVAGATSISTSGPRRLIHPQAVIPGAILGVGSIGFIGFNSFLPLFGEEIGVDNVAPFFLLSSFTIVLIRGFGARLPDALGPRRGGSVALALIATGLAAIGGLQSTLGLVVGSAIVASGAALMLPSLVTAAIDGVPPTQRSFALASYTLFMEIAGAVGSILFGGIAALANYGVAFLVSAGLALVALAMLRALIPPRPAGWTSGGGLITIDGEASPMDGTGQATT